MGDNKVTSTYKLDGTESKNTMMGRGGAPDRVNVDGEVGRQQARTITTKRLGDGTIRVTQTWSLAGGELTVESTGGRGTAEARLQEDHVVGQRAEQLELRPSSVQLSASGHRAHRCAGSATFALTSGASSRSAASPAAAPTPSGPMTGSTRSGATSASGPSTKKRSRNRGCGTCEPWRLDDRVAEQDQIEIEGAGGAGERPLASEGLLDGEQRVEELGAVRAVVADRRPHSDRAADPEAPPLRFGLDESDTQGW